MNERIIQYILGAHWQKRPAVSIAASVLAKFGIELTVAQVRECVANYTLRHHGEVVERKNWPCDQNPVCK